MNKELKNIIEDSKNVVFFGGAGVSTESGIPDFRSENGLYNAKNNYGHSPEEIISHSFFVHDPYIFYDYYKKYMVAPKAKPNKAHRALAKLEEQGKLLAVVTQNIDGLHQMAGSKKVYELHGSVHRNYCQWCRKEYDLSYILDEANCKKNIHDGMLGIPMCTCGGMLKPDVVLYEEGLDDVTITNAVDAISKADCLIIGGTSLAVYPAASFIHYFKGRHLVVINKSATSVDERAELVIRDPIGEAMDLD